MPGQKLIEKTGKHLPGSEWLVEGADGFSLKVVDNGDNDADPTPGSMRVDGLMWGKKKDTGAVWGTYTLTETKAPEGYAFDPNAAAAAKKTVHFDETTDFDKPIDLGAITNARKLGSARWTKVDASDSTLLPGSEWLVEGADGFSLKVVDNGDNDADPEQGAFLVNDLAWGTYTLTETKAPTGYQLADKPTNFDVKSTNLDVKLEPLSNTKTEVPEPPTKNEDKPKKTTPTKEKLPQTSDTSTLVIASVAVIALAFIASGADMRLRSAR
ncbi:collagen binding domain-containing protein [Alloscardovia omnicolens]|uniref:MSCRAMM family protein n=1 Tax=Alloscardovia omnicolens TaxID=419015 RepID=UPI003A659FAD